MKQEKFILGQESYGGEAADVENLLAQINERSIEDQRLLLAALQRYNSEGEKKTYRSDPTALMDFLSAEGLINRSNSLVDLGAGSGDLVRLCATTNPKMKVLGVDLSPSFVRGYNTTNGSRNSSMKLGLIDAPSMPAQIDDWRNGDVISVLTLDRAANPKTLISNMGAFRGSKILAALLPNRPWDDNPSIPEDERRTYTEQEKRVTEGASADGDRAQLIAYLTHAWGSEVQSAEVPYVVESSGDRQEYSLSVFYTK